METFIVQRCIARYAVNSLIKKASGPCNIHGAIDVGPPMSHVNFKKCDYPVDFNWPNVACRF